MNTTKEEEIQNLIASEEANATTLGIKLNNEISILQTMCQELNNSLSADQEEEKLIHANIVELEKQKQNLENQIKLLKTKEYGIKEKNQEKNNILTDDLNLIQIAKGVFFDIKSNRYFPAGNVIFSIRDKIFQNKNLHLVMATVLEIEKLMNSSLISDMINKYRMTQAAEMTVRNDSFFKHCAAVESELNQLEKNLERKKNENLKYEESIILQDEISQLKKQQAIFAKEAQIKTKVQNGTITQIEATQSKLEYWSDQNMIETIYLQFKETEQELKNLWAKRFQAYTAVLIEEGKGKTMKLLKNYENHIYSKLKSADRNSPTINQLFGNWINTFITMWASFCNDYQPTGAKMLICDNCKEIRLVSCEVRDYDDEITITLIPAKHHRLVKCAGGPGFSDDYDTIYNCPRK